MADLKTQETERVSTDVDQSGAVTKERSRTVKTNPESKTTAINLIWYVYGFIAALLGIRLIMKLFGANSANSFVDLIYNLSGVFSAPFDGIFGVARAEAGTTQSVFEPSILVAVAVYALIAWGVVKLLTINDKQ